MGYKSRNRNDETHERLIMDLTLREKLRSGHVKRWHIVRVNRDQTLAEHSYRVWLVAMDLSKRFFPGLQPETLQLINDWALWHDLTEVITGDIVTPTKKKHISGNPDMLISDEYDALFKKVDGTIVKVIVKIADLIESAMFLNTEGLGAHAHSVKIGIIDDIDKLLSSSSLKWPELNWKVVYNILSEVL